MPSSAPPYDPRARRPVVDLTALGQAIEAVGDAVLVYELLEHGLGAFLAANEVALERYGYDLDELLALDPRDLIVDGGIRNPQVESDLRGGHKVTTDALHRASDGHEVRVEVTLSLLELQGRLAVICVARDVSARRAAEVALRDSEERLKVALSAAPLVLNRVNRELRYEWVFDPRTEGGKAELGAIAGATLPPEEGDTYRDFLTRAMDKGEAVQGTLTVGTPGGQRSYQLTVNPLRDETGEVIGATTAAYDVTDVRRAEAALRASEERLRLAQRAAHIGTWEADPETGRATWSEGMWELVGMEPRVDPDRGLWKSLIHPDDAARAAERYDSALAAGDDFGDEFRMVRPDGATIWVASRGRVMRDEDGRPVRVLGVNFDITERRATEEALRASEERSIMAQRAAHVGTWELDVPSGNVVWSEGIWDLIGEEQGSVRPTFDVWMEHVHDDDREHLLERFRAALEAGDDYQDEFRLRTHDGRVTWITTRGRIVRDESGRALKLIGVNVDVTDRREAESAARASAAELRRFADAMPQLAYIAEGKPGEFPEPVYYNEQWYEYTGMTRAPVPDTNWYGFLHPDEREPARLELGRAIDTGTPFELEYRFRRQDGEYRWFLGRSIPVADERAEVVRWFGTCTDIHDLKVAEAALAEANTELEGRVARRTAALRASEALLASVLETSLDAVTVAEAVRDQSGSIVEFRWRLANPAAGALFGLPVESMIGQVPDDLGIPFHDTDLYDLHRRVVETGEPVRHRFQYVRDGYDAWVDLTAVKLGDGCAATFRDVSAQVVTESALRDSETRFRLLVEGVRDYAIFLLDVDGHVISWNAGAERMKRYAADDIIGRHFSVLYAPEDREAAFEGLRAAAREGRSEEEAWHLRGDGTGFWGHSVLTALHDDTNRLTGFARLTRDVSERRAAENAIRENEQRFRSLFDTTPIGVAVIAPDGRLLEANPALATLLGREAGALRGAKLMELTHAGDRRLLAPLFAGLLARDSTSFHIEGRFVRKDGGVVWAQTTASVVSDPDGEPMYVVASVADVTERRRLEEAAIEAAETERRRLSYELHDDLAQRLAGASVLSHTLGEQLRDDEHPGAVTAVRLGDLVRDAMAHARALSRALAPVDLLSEGLAEALGRLCTSTEQAYGVPCHFVSSVDAQVADPAMATHLFRIAQEAVSNAGRHAQATQISLSLEGGSGGLRLVISDDGVGLPQSAVGTTAGLGLRTMRSRAAALGGTLVLDGSEHGTTVRVVVPLRGRQDD